MDGAKTPAVAASEAAGANDKAANLAAELA